MKIDMGPEQLITTILLAAVAFVAQKLLGYVFNKICDYWFKPKPNNNVTDALSRATIFVMYNTARDRPHPLRTTPSPRYSW